jgi:hypothetical protein
MSAAFSLWDLGGCNCPASCAVTFTVESVCNNSGLGAGITVSVYDHSGGTLLASGTTNGSSQVALSWSGVTGTYYVTANTSTVSARFADVGISTTLTCGSPKTLAAPAATGYHCYSNLCQLPLKNTLTATFTVAGACTLTWSGINTWTGTLSGSTVTFSANLNISSCGSSAISFNACPPALNITSASGAVCPAFGNCTITE